MYYFISDPHFGHENILKMCQRPFESVEEMNEAMIDAWNQRVTGNDTVFILGDLFYRCPDPEPILQRLKGKKRLIIGNHDSSWNGQGGVKPLFRQRRSFPGDHRWRAGNYLVPLSAADLEAQAAYLYGPWSYP